MIKIIFIVLLSISGNFSYSQDSKETTIKKIKTFLFKYQVNLSTGKTGKTSVIYYNKIEKIIDIDGYQIPLQEVKITYYISKTKNHLVSFDCENDDCIMNPNGILLTGFAIPFLTKANCYSFIELIDQLKK